MSNLKHEEKYVNWYQEADMVYLKRNDWDDMIDTLDFDLRLIPAKGMKTIRSLYLSGYWAYDRAISKLFRYNESDDKYEIIGAYNVNAETGEEEISLTGGEARKLFTKEMEGGKWQKRYGCLYQNCGQFKDSPFENFEIVQKIHNINRCVGPFIGNDFCGNMTIEKGLWKADVKSAYPANSLDNLPDLHQCEIVYGEIEPTEEWPIVYYLDSHNIAEYGVFDTRVDRLHYLYQNFRNIGNNKRYTKNGLYKNEPPISFITPFEKEWCLRCKYAAKGLRDEMELFYRNKENGDTTAKQIINKVIGTLDFVILDNETHAEVISLDRAWIDMEGNAQYSEYTRSGYYGHLRAVILARHNHKMCQYYNEIKKKKYKFVCIQTDSIMWIGDGPIDSAVKSKEMGSLNLEIENGEGYIHRLGVYYVKDNKGNEVIKCQGVKGFEKKNVKDVESFKNELNRKKVMMTDFNPETLKFNKIIYEEDIDV